MHGNDLPNYHKHTGLLMALAHGMGTTGLTAGTYVVQSLWPHGLAYFHPHPIHAQPGWSPFGAATLAWGAIPCRCCTTSQISDG